MEKARKGDLYPKKVYMYTASRGPIVCPRRMLVILIPRAEPKYPFGIWSESNATLDGHVMLHNPTMAEYDAISIIQLSVSSQRPNNIGIGVKQDTRIFFRPYLSAS